MMRLQYVAVVAVATLASTTDGLQIAPNSGESTSLRASADVRYPPYIEGKGDRFLASEANTEVSDGPPTDYTFSTLEEDDDEYDDYNNSPDEDAEDENRFFGWRRKKKKSKHHKATETPTPTPTPAVNGTETPQPQTPEPTTWAPEINLFIAWLNRFSD